MPRLLLVDDDTRLCELLCEYLAPEGFEVVAVHDGVVGLDKALNESFDLIILDVMLPGTNGFDLLRQLRARRATPVVMLTARGDDVDRIVGLEMGADDYLPKPFNARELVARIRSVLRRSMTEPCGGSTDRQVRIGDLLLDQSTRCVWLCDVIVDLTAVEFQLLEQLLRHAGSPLSREALSLVVLGRPLTVFDRSIDGHVSRLRKKLGPHTAGLERIRAIRGTGYVYTLPPFAPDSEI